MANIRGGAAHEPAYRSRARSQAGTMLFLLGVTVLLPCSVVLFVDHNAAIDDVWQRHYMALAEIPHDELLSRLDSLADRDARLATDIGSVCPSTPGSDADHQVFVITAVDGRLCGPPVDSGRLQPGKWVGVDGLLVHSLVTADGFVVGTAIDPGVLLPVGWDRTGIGLRLISGGVVLASTDRADRSLGSLHVPEDRELISPLADNPVDLAVVLPPEVDNDQGWYSLVVAALVVVISLVGLALRVCGPIAHWWHCVGAPDDAQLLLVDGRGLVRSASRHRHHDATGTALCDRFALQDRARVADLLFRSAGAGLGATMVCSTVEGPRVRLVTVAWLPVLRRQLVLVTRYVADPAEAVISDDANRARSSIVDADGMLLHISIRPTLMIGPNAAIGECLYDMLEPCERAVLRSAHNKSLSQPFRIVALQLQHHWNRYQILMASDDRAKTYLCVEDISMALLGDLLAPFVEQLSDYLRREGSPRPDVALLCRRLRIPAHDDGESVDRMRSRERQLIDSLHVLLRFADRDRLVQSSASEQRRSAARHREFARRIHEDVVQDLVALRWSVASDNAMLAVHDRVLHTTRTILAELRVTPWEQRLRDMLAPLLQSVRESGVSISLHVDTPDPIPFEVISVVVVVAKEALTNASKHARPDEVVVDLRMVGANHLLLTVSDDGATAPDASVGTGYGVNMCVDLAQEYGGSFAVMNESNGHVARLLIPLEINAGENGSLSLVDRG